MCGAGGGGVEGDWGWVVRRETENLAEGVCLRGVLDDAFVLIRLQPGHPLTTSTDCRTRLLFLLYFIFFFLNRHKKHSGERFPIHLGSLLPTGNITERLPLMVRG